MIINKPKCVNASHDEKQTHTWFIISYLRTMFAHIMRPWILWFISWFSRCNFALKDLALRNGFNMGFIILFQQGFIRFYISAGVQQGFSRGSAGVYHGVQHVFNKDTTSMYPTFSPKYLIVLFHKYLWMLRNSKSGPAEISQEAKDQFTNDNQ